MSRITNPTSASHCGPWRFARRAIALATLLAMTHACGSDGQGTSTGPDSSDDAAIEVSQPSGNTGEDGREAEFTVALAAEPTAPVTVRFDSNDHSEGLVDRSSLTFTRENWDTPQSVTITGVDDDQADGDQPYAIIFEQTDSEDEGYAGLRPSDIELTNLDDESPGFRVTEPSGPTTEAGGEASFSVVLNTQPMADVTVSLESSDTSEGTVDATSLTFTADNWDAPQTITVTGVDDDVADGDQTYAITFGETASSDEVYSGTQPEDVVLTNIDDESAGVSLTEPSESTTEAGGETTFDLVLNSQPSADVTLTFDTTDPSEGTVDPTFLKFSPQNWNTPQTVVVTGVDDQMDDGDQDYAVQFQPAVSGDGDYDAMTPPDVELTNLDDDTAGISVGSLSGPTSEWGDQASFEVVLDSMPSGDVTVTLASDDTSEAAVAPDSLTFAPQDWDTPQSVTVSGVDDNFDDGDQSYAISFGAPSSTDNAYAAMSLPSLSGTNIDDDTAGFVVSPTSGTTTEDGGQFNFTVQLSSEPYDNVTVNFSSSDTSEGQLDQTSLTFAPQAWSSPQTVTVTGQSDSTVDGDQSYTIAFGATSSNDADYAAIRPTDIQMVNQDTTLSCDPNTEVDYNGKCYYLDGSGGVCQSGYTLAPQSVLHTIAGNFAGKTYKTTTSGNCCIWHRDQSFEQQDWGMGTGDCNEPGTFGVGPALGGYGCTNAMQTQYDQLTLCMSQ